MNELLASLPRTVSFSNWVVVFPSRKGRDPLILATTLPINNFPRISISIPYFLFLVFSEIFTSKLLMFLFFLVFTQKLGDGKRKEPCNLSNFVLSFLKEPCNLSSFVLSFPLAIISTFFDKICCFWFSLFWRNDGLFGHSILQKLWHNQDVHH